MRSFDSLRVLPLFVLFGGLLLQVGCGSGMTSSVSGRVTLDGQAVTTGNVTFIPAKDGVMAYGTIASDGSYSLNTGTAAGINPGDYTVIVIVPGPIPPEVPGKAPLPPIPLSPMKYAAKETSDLKVTVKPGVNTIPLEMKSK